MKFLSFDSKIAAAILARYQWSTTTKRSLKSAVMSLSSWSSSKCSILAWNSATEFKMNLSRESTFSVFKSPTYQEWPTDSLSLSGLLWVWLVQEIRVSSICPATERLPLPFRTSSCRGGVLSWVPGSLHGRSRFSSTSTRTSCSANWCRAEWIRCIAFPPKCLHEGQIHRSISSMQSQSLSPLGGSLSVQGL